MRRTFRLGIASVVLLTLFAVGLVVQTSGGKSSGWPNCRGTVRRSRSTAELQQSNHIGPLRL
jgi:hypothetical protein